MDVNDIYLHILQLSERSSGDSDLSDYLQTLFQGGGIQAHREVFFYSNHGQALVGVAAFLLSAFFFICAYKRRWQPAVVATLAIPLVLLFELSLHIPVVSWPLLNKGENIIVQFPVQNASQKVIIGAQCRYLIEPTDTPSSFEATISAFLLPAALTLLAMGLWQLALYFGKFRSEDLRTIMLVMGGICVIYFGAWTIVSWKAASKKHMQKQMDNAASAAILSRLASDMGARDIRPENTWVTIVFFGGTGGEGAEVFARRLSHKQEHSIETFFISCHDAGQGGDLRLTIPLREDREVAPPDHRFVQMISAAAAASGAPPPETVISDTASTVEFAARGYPSAVLTSLPPSAPKTDSADGGEGRSLRLSAALKLLKNMISRIDAEQLQGRVPPPELSNR